MQHRATAKTCGEKLDPSCRWAKSKDTMSSSASTAAGDLSVLAPARSPGSVVTV